MRQRIAIAIALVCRPKLLIADEPTTALDVTVQAGIIRLLDRLRREQGLSIVLITHDLGVLSPIADALAIFYAGRVVEAGAREDVLSHPRAPVHARAAGRSAASGVGGAAARRDPGSAAGAARAAARMRVPPPLSSAQPVSREVVPPLVPVEGGRLLACHVDPFRDGQGAGGDGDTPGSGTVPTPS